MRPRGAESRSLGGGDLVHVRRPAGGERRDPDDEVLRRRAVELERRRRPTVCELDTSWNGPVAESPAWICAAKPGVSVVTVTLVEPTVPSRRARARRRACRDARAGRCSVSVGQYVVWSPSVASGASASCSLAVARSAGRTRRRPGERIGAGRRRRRRCRSARRSRRRAPQRVVADPADTREQREPEQEQQQRPDAAARSARRASAAAAARP